MVFNWGTGIANIKDNIVMQYHYFGIFWIFTFCLTARYFQVTGIENIIVREFSRKELKELGIQKPWRSVPLFRRFGLLALIVAAVMLNIFEQFYGSSF